MITLCSCKFLVPHFALWNWLALHVKTGKLCDMDSISSKEAIKKIQVHLVAPGRKGTGNDPNKITSLHFIQ